MASHLTRRTQPGLTNRGELPRLSSEYDGGRCPRHCLRLRDRLFLQRCPVASATPRVNCAPGIALSSMRNIIDSNRARTRPQLGSAARPLPYVQKHNLAALSAHRAGDRNDVRCHRVGVADLTPHLQRKEDVAACPNYVSRAAPKRHAGAMNFVGHIATGLRATSADAPGAFIIGTALPDFASMAKLRLTERHGALAEGIAVHHSTDRAFHSHEWFLDVVSTLRESLRCDGLPDGASRACAHVAPELLLDGVLIDEPVVARGVDRVYEALANPAADVVALVAPPTRQRWRSHLINVTARLDPYGYRDTQVVAERLHAIASRRPRLSFDADSVKVVAARLQQLQPDVQASAQTVLGDVSSAVAAHCQR